MNSHQPVDQDSDNNSSAAQADPSPDQGMHDPPAEHLSLGMQARPAAPEPMQQPAEADNDHNADVLHAQTDAQVSDAQLSNVAQLPSVLVPLEQPAQVADEHGDGMPHAQSDADAPVAAQAVPTIRGVLNTCTTFIVGSILSLLPDEASPTQDNCTASNPPDQQQPELSAATDRGMPSAQVQPSGIQVLAAAASDRGMPDDVNPSLSHEAAGAEGCDSMADS